MAVRALAITAALLTTAEGFTAPVSLRPSAFLAPAALRISSGKALHSPLARQTSRGFVGSLSMSGSAGQWEQTKDESGNVYWYNTVTMETSWEAPMAAPARAAQPKFDPNDPNPKVYPGGVDGLKAALNPIKPGVNPLKEPSLILFFGFKAFIIGWAIFVGFHNQYAGDFGPFITFHDGQVDFGQASKEWARLHPDVTHTAPGTFKGGAK